MGLVQQSAVADVLLQGVTSAVADRCARRMGI